MRNDTHALWAMNHDPAWLAGNANMPDMVIMSGTLYDVHFARQRIALLTGDDTRLDIRDVPGNTIYTVREIPNPGRNPTLEITDTRPRHTDKPKRRTLSTREN